MNNENETHAVPAKEENPPPYVLSRTFRKKIFLNTYPRIRIRKRFEPRILSATLAAEISPYAEDRGVELLFYLDHHLPETLYGDGDAVCRILKNLLYGEVSSSHGGWVGLWIAVLPSVSSGHRVTLRFSIQSAALETPPCRELGNKYFQRITHAVCGCRRMYFDLNVYRAENAALESSECDSTAREDSRLAITVPPRILLVQKDSFVRSGVEKNLVRQGWSVSTAEDPAEVQRLFLQERYRAVILDAALPDEIPAEVIIRLKLIPAREEYRMVPLILLTAHARDEKIRDVFHNCIEDYVFKPVDPDELEKTLLNLRCYREGMDQEPVSDLFRTSIHPADIARIRMLFSSHAELISEVARVFPDEAGRHLLEMREGILRSDFTAITRAAHCLVSDTGIAGFCTVIRLLREIIDSAERKDRPMITRIFRLLPSEILRIAALYSASADSS